MEIVLNLVTMNQQVNMSDINDWDGSGTICNQFINDKSINCLLAQKHYNGKEEVDKFIPLTFWVSPERIQQQAHMLSVGSVIFVQGELNVYTNKRGEEKFGINVIKYRIGKYGKPKDNQEFAGNGINNNENKTYPEPSKVAELNPSSRPQNQQDTVFDVRQEDSIPF